MIEEEKGKKKKKPEKKEGKDHKPKPQAPTTTHSAQGEDKNFVHLVRLAGVVVDGNLTVPKALRKIKGVGPRVAETFVIKTGLTPTTRVGSLNEEQITDIEKKLENINTILPHWMLNRRKDVVLGVDLHKLGPDLDFQTREDINREKKIRSYRGIRHSLGLPVRGQRTRSSFREGTTLGVSRKKAVQAQKQAAKTTGKDDKKK